MDIRRSTVRAPRGYGQDDGVSDAASIAKQREQERMANQTPVRPAPGAFGSPDYVPSSVIAERNARMRTTGQPNQGGRIEGRGQVINYPASPYTGATGAPRTPVKPVPAGPMALGSFTEGTRGMTGVQPIQSAPAPMVAPAVEPMEDETPEVRRALVPPPAPAAALPSPAPIQAQPPQYVPEGAGTTPAQPITSQPPPAKTIDLPPEISPAGQRQPQDINRMVGEDVNRRISEGARRLFSNTPLAPNAMNLNRDRRYSAQRLFNSRGFSGPLGSDF